MAKSVTNKSNEVRTTVYCSVAEHAFHRQVADQFFDKSISKAMVSRFREMENVLGIPEDLRPRVRAAAAAEGISVRTYVFNLVLAHAMSLPAVPLSPEPTSAAAPGKDKSGRSAPDR